MRSFILGGAFMFDGLIGNENIKSTLGNAILNKKFLHAYIIEGAYGTGKHTVARLASASIMCQGNKMPCKKCNFCEKILNDRCVDVRFFDAFTVDDVRKIKEGLYDSCAECDYKIYILNDVQKMNVKAQNALLIALEEPPKHVIFFLLTTDASFLLETIRSRAQILRTKPLDNDTIYRYIENNVSTNLSKESIKEIIVSARGSLGYALDMLDEKRSESLISDRSKAKDLVLAYLTLDNSALSFISSLFSQKRDKLKEIFNLSLTALRDLAVSKRSKSAPLCFFSSYDEAISIAGKHSLKKILALYDSFEKGLNDLNTNASVYTTLMSLATGGI